MSNLLIPLFFVPQQVTECIVTGMNSEDDGTLVAVNGFAFDFHALGIFAGLRIEPNRGLKQMVPVDALVSNNQPTMSDYRVEIRELVKAGYESALLDIFGACDYIRIQITSSTFVGSGVDGKTTAVIAAIDGAPFAIGEGDPTVIALAGLPCGYTVQRGTAESITLPGGS